MSKTETVLFLVGGLLMVVGAGCFAFMWQRSIACWVFMVGAVLFTVMQAMQTYSGQSLVIRRLKRIQALAGIFFIIAAILMVDADRHFLLPSLRARPDTSTILLIYIINGWLFC